MVEFASMFALHIQTNHLPILKMVGDADVRRIRVIDYPIKFCSNPTAPNERKGDPSINTRSENNPELYNAIFQDLMRVYKDEVQNADCIPMPEDCLKHTQVYLDDNDRIKAWFDERLVKDDKGRIKSTDLFKDYIAWATLNDPTRKMDNKKFAETLRAKFSMESSKLGGTMTYKGYRLAITTTECDD
jgi:phage/plasmid-associated DNA primase